MPVFTPKSSFFSVLLGTLLWLASLPGYGQATSKVISGEVLDQATRKPLGYVSVGVLRQPFGTVADAQGYFLLSLPTSYDADSVRFSLIGYARRTLRVADLRQVMHAGPLLLRAQAVPLTEARVQSKTLKQRVLGNSTPGLTLRMDGFDNNMAGNQIGQLIRIEKPAFLERVALRLFHCTYDTAYFRLNIYKLRNDYPAENILPTSIYWPVSREEAHGSVSLDLRPYHLYLTEDVVVALELVDSLGPGELWFRQPLVGGGPHYRLEQTPGPHLETNVVPTGWVDSHDLKVPQPGGPWVKYPHVGVGIKAIVLQQP